MRAKIPAVFLLALILALLVTLVSGLLPTQETLYGKSCGYSFDLDQTVCEPVPYTWTRHGWLVQLLEQ